MSVFRGASVGVTLTANKSRYSRELKEARREMRDWQKSVDSSMSKAKRSVKLFGTAGAAAIGVGFAVAVKSGVDELVQMQKVTAQTGAAIKSTGGVANVAAKDVERLASALQRQSGHSDEVIASGANMLLTFTKVRNEVGKGNKVFDRATQAALDLSVAGFGSMSDTSKQLGKALNDPIKGISALSRSGVSFTQQQKEQIRALTESGRVLEAQKIILREVETQVGGSAKAYGETLPGQIAKAKETFGDLTGVVVAAALPAFMRLTDSVADSLARFDAWSKTTAGRQALERVGVVANKVTGALGTMGSALFGTARFLAKHSTATLAAAAALGTFVVGMKAAAFIGTLSAGVNLAIVSWKGYQAATAGATVTQWALNTALTANPVGLVVVGLAALAAGVVVAYRKSETFREGVQKLGRVMAMFGGVLRDGAVRQFNILRVVAGHVTGRLYSNEDSVYNTMRKVASLITTTVKAAIDKLERAFGRLKDTLKPVANMLGRIGGSLGGIGGAAGRAAGGIAGAIGSGWPISMGLGGGVVGSVDSFTPMAQRAGLTMTSGFRAGDPGYHGVGRARDYSNGSGPTPEMMSFARFLASNFGSRLKELIYTPLGFSIKNGRKVAPYATAGHYNHVHVAYQRGTMGVVPGSGSGDKIPALLEPAEGVLNRNAVAALGGPGFVEAANKRWPRFARGRTPSTGMIRRSAMVQAAVAADPERSFRAAQVAFNRLAAQRLQLERRIQRATSRAEKARLRQQLAAIVGKQRESAQGLAAATSTVRDSRQAARTAAAEAAAEATRVAEEERVAVRQAQLDAPRTMMTLTDAIRDLERAQAEATETLEDDIAVSRAALRDEEARQAQIQAVLNRGDLSPEERAEAVNQMAASIRAATGLRGGLRDLESQTASAAGGATLDDLLNQLKATTQAIYAAGASEAGNVFSIAKLEQVVQGGATDFWALQTQAQLQGAVGV